MRKTQQDVFIRFELDPLIDVVCMATDCKNHLFMLGEPNCNLKHIRISGEHGCMEYEPREQEAGKHAST